MNLDGLVAALRKSVLNTYVADLSETELEQHLLLLDLAEGLQPGCSEGEKGYLLRLMEQSEQWAEENPDEFLEECDTRASIAFRYASEQWARLNPEAFLKQCQNLREDALRNCPETWFELSPETFKAAWEAALCHAPRAELVYHQAYPNLFLLQCKRNPHFLRGSELWAKLDPEGHGKACEEGSDGLLSYNGKACLVWKETNPESFWTAVEKQVEAIAELRQDPEAYKNTSRSLEYAGNDLAPPIIEILWKERPELLSKMLTEPFGRRSEINDKHAFQGLRENPEKWQALDALNYQEACFQAPTTAITGVPRLSVEGKASLLEYLHGKTGEEISKLDADSQAYLKQIIRLLGDNPEGEWHPVLLREAFSSTFMQRANAQTETEKRTTLHALGYLLEQAGEGERREVLSYVLASRTKRTYDKEVLDLYGAGNPLLYTAVFKELTDELSDPSAMAYEYSRAARNLASFLRDMRETTGQLLENLKTTSLSLYENLELLLELTLNEEQTRDLTEWVINTPGLNTTAVTWATVRAGNLNTTPNIRLKKSRPSVDRDGMGVA